MAPELIVGVSGGPAQAAAAATGPAGLVAACPQERLTRSRGAGVNASGLPDEAVAAVARQAGPATRVGRFVMAGPGDAQPREAPIDYLDRHEAYAAAAYLSSPHAAATIVVCDRSAPRVSVWSGRDGALARLDRPWHGPAFADLYARGAELVGFAGEARGQRMEALARLCPNPGDPTFDGLWTTEHDRLVVADGWAATVADAFDRAGGVPGVATAPVAAALEAAITRALLAWLATVRRDVGGGALCVGGTLFYHSSLNSALRQSGLFDDVFVPVDPGVPGLAVGAALHGRGGAPREVSPFLGPAYSDDEVKATLDNCKLHYAWEADQSVIDQAVEALMSGHLVGWYEGAMEWGPRALGGRSILASPQSPYVLENLNRFLKRREPWRGYALSAPQDVAAREFHGPATARFMECDFMPRDPTTFRHVMPHPKAAVRIQTVDESAPPRFRRLLAAFGEASGLPVLVNTSFNGFQEPIVCSPRDALRVFYGTGLDMLVLNQFVLRK